MIFIQALTSSLRCNLWQRLVPRTRARRQPLTCPWARVDGRAKVRVAVLVGELTLRGGLVPEAALARSQTAHIHHHYKTSYLVCMHVAPFFPVRRRRFDEIAHVDYILALGCKAEGMGSAVLQYCFQQFLFFALCSFPCLFPLMSLHFVH